MRHNFETCARLLVDARLKGPVLEGLPEHLRPAGLCDAYMIQQRAIELWADEIAGWKVGATSAEVQALFGITEPVFGPVFKKNTYQSPAHLSATAYRHRMLETEFAFRFGEDIPRRSTPYLREEIVASIDAIIPALEIVNPRYTTLTVGHIPQLVADFCANGGAVLGAICTEWRAIDLVRQPATLVVGGIKQQEGTGALVLGNPLNVVEWLVNRFNERGKSISKGQFVMTGTMTGIHAPGVGQPAKACFDALGSVEVVFGNSGTV